MLCATFYSNNIRATRGDGELQAVVLLIPQRYV